MGNLGTVGEGMGGQAQGQGQQNGTPAGPSGSQAGSQQAEGGTVPGPNTSNGSVKQENKPINPDQSGARSGARNGELERQKPIDLTGGAD